MHFDGLISIYVYEYIMKHTETCEWFLYLPTHWQNALHRNLSVNKKAVFVSKNKYQKYKNNKNKKYCQVVWIPYTSLKALKHLYCDMACAFKCLLLFYTQQKHFNFFHIFKVSSRT